MKHYTGRGDSGKTDLQNGRRVSKTSERIEAYGTVDELNSLIGCARSKEECTEEIDAVLSSVQNNLHIIQAELSNPDSNGGTPKIERDAVDEIEDTIDKYGNQTPELESFILPTGCELGADLHHARSVARRAERRIVGLSNSEPINNQVSIYMNRISDLLFTLARYVNAEQGVEEESPTY